MGAFRDLDTGAPQASSTFREMDGAPPAKKSQALGFAKGLERPLDNMAVWLEGGANKLGIPTDKINDALHLPSAREAMDAHASAVKDYAAKGVKPGGIGEVAGGIVGTIPAALVTKNPWIAGGLQGAMSAEHPEDLGDVAANAAGGAVLNKAGTMAMEGLAKVAKPVIDPAVKMLADAGVRLTPGQIKGGKAMVREDKAMSQPRVGEMIAGDRAQGIADFNRGAINKALLPLGIRLPDNIQTGHDAVAFAQDAMTTAYSKITPNLKLTPDARMVAGARKAMNVVSTLPEREADIFDKVVERTMQFNGGPLSGRPLAVALRDVKDFAAGYAKSDNEAERQLGKALGHLDDGIQSALGAQNPGYAKALSAVNKAYKGTMIMSGAAKGADEGIASTGQLKSAVRQADRTKNQRATAAGRAYMQDYSEAGRKVLPAKTPDSGTAGRQNSDNWIANTKGAVSSLGYKADKAYSNFLLAPRPGWATDLGGLLKDYRHVGGAAGGPALGGLLASLFGDD